MMAAMTAILQDGDLASSLARIGLDAVLQRHTCAHRARELLGIVDQLDAIDPVQSSAGQYERIAS
jgi:spore maturation protein CgeB